MAAPTWVWNGTSTASTTTAAIPYPVSGVLANDVPFLVVISKATSGTGEPPALADPAGFTKLFEAWGGTGTAGAGTGPVKLTVWQKTTDADGTENGTTVSVVNPANSSFVYGNIHGVRRATAGTTIQTAFSSGQDSSAGTAWSVTCAADPGISVDDLLFWLAGATVNTSGTFTVEAITATGCTFGTMTEREDAGTNSGNDGRRVVADMACTAGPSSAAPVLTATSASASQSGVGAILRIREQASSTPVTLADVGSASDAVDVAAAVPLGDVGGGSDTLAVEAAVPLADSGSAVDSFSVAIPVPLVDAGSAVDSFAISSAVPLADTGIGTDTLAVAASVPLADVGSASDSFTVVQGGTAITLNDVGAATDSLTVTAAVPLTDSGQAVDTVAVAAAVPLVDAGSAVDSFAVQQIVPKPLSDLGAATDSLTVTAAVPLADLGAAADSIAVTALLGLADTGSATDSFSVQIVGPGAPTPGTLTAADQPLATLGTTSATGTLTATDKVLATLGSSSVVAVLAATMVMAGGPS